MADTAARLIGDVLPTARVRQWVLTLPWGLRYRMAHDAGLTSDVLRVFVGFVFPSLQRRARRPLPGRVPSRADDVRANLPRQPVVALENPRPSGRGARLRGSRGRFSG